MQVLKHSTQCRMGDASMQDGAAETKPIRSNTMGLNRIRIGFLCTAALVWPSLTLAQTGSTNNPNQLGPQSNPQSNNQPAQPGQQQPGTAPPAMANMMTGSSATSAEAQSMRDQVFVRRAAEGGVAEVQLGHLAAQKGSADDVKAFGQKMVDDHTILNANMKPVAESMDIRVPTTMNKEDQAEYNKLNALSGDDFDKEYLAYMVKNHHHDLRESRMEAYATTNVALKQAVEVNARVVMQHTHAVDELAKSKGVPVPQRPARPAQLPPPPPQ
jgi:putative membrane protein